MARLLARCLPMVLIGQTACGNTQARNADTAHVDTQDSVPTYGADRRQPIGKLHQVYMSLVNDHGWSVETIYRQTDTGDAGSLELPILGFKTAHEGNSLWILSGIHGEEPAGPNALAAEIETIAALAEQGVAMVVLPLCNPKAYRNNWRYPNTPERDWRKGGYSVGDSEHLLPDLETGSRPRTNEPRGPDTAALTAWVLRTADRHRPVLVIDHHEDEELDGGYIYSQGVVSSRNPVAKEVIATLKRSEVPLKLAGKTRFGEVIEDGVINSDDKGHRIRDGSVDELLASPRVFVDGRARSGPAAETVIVVETPTRGVPLSKRVSAHRDVIRALGRLWLTSQAIDD